VHTHKVSIEVDGECLFLGEINGADILRLMAATRAQTMGIVDKAHFDLVKLDGEIKHQNKERFNFNQVMVVYTDAQHPKKIGKIVQN
jgi:hypothetical protein